MLYPILTYSREIGDFSYDLKQLHQNGLKAVRLIYKGKSEQEFNVRLNEIKDVSNKYMLDLDILIDLPGSKPIVGNLAGKLQVVKGEEYYLSTQAETDSIAIIPTENFFSHAKFHELTIGDIISIADDELNLKIKSITKTQILCEALNSFPLTSGRSISIKNKPFPFEANSEKDLRFVQNLTTRGVKLLVSFTKSADDIRTVRDIQPELEVVPKIESILDDETLAEIINECQTVMLGRGDLSTSAQPNELFAFQNRLIGLCKKRNKQLIIATGILAGIGEKGAPSITDIMDYGYLRDVGVDAFLIAGSNAHNMPFETLQFMEKFEEQNLKQNHAEGSN